MQPVFAAHGITVPVFGMVKDGKHKTRAITAGGADIQIKSTRGAYTLVTAIQDEVHRFAIGYHRARRSGAMLKSSLVEIDGVGEKTAAALLKHFKTLKAISAAEVRDLAAVKGVSKKAAENVFAHFHGAAYTNGGTHEN